MSDENDCFAERSAELKTLPDGTVLCLSCGKSFSLRVNAKRHYREIHRGVKRIRNGRHST